MKLAEETSFVSPEKIVLRVFCIGPKWMQIVFGSAENTIGSVQGYIQVILWRINMLLSVKWQK